MQIFIFIFILNKKLPTFNLKKNDFPILELQFFLQIIDVVSDN